MTGRARVRESKRHARITVATADPAGLAAYVATLRPIVASLRALTEDATAAPEARVYDRLYLRRFILKDIRELEARLDAASPAAPDDGAPVVPDPVA